MSVSVAAFLNQAQAIEKEKPTYRTGGDGSDGTCDCIGLIIGAIRRAGGKWNGLHGSNWAARNEMTQAPKSIVSAKNLQPGMVVFKAYDVFDDGYNLPSRYQGDKDARDYHHIGIVLSGDPLVILHCTTNGGNDVIRDTKLRKWSFCGWLKKVSSGKTESEHQTIQEGKIMKVDTPNGGSLNMRQTPKSNANVLTRISNGAEVSLVETVDEHWSRILWDGMEGYVVSAYLSGDDGAESVTVTLPRDVAEKLREALGNITA